MMFEESYKHPKRDHTAPVWEWIERCVEAEDGRSKFIDQILHSPTEHKMECVPVITSDLFRIFFNEIKNPEDRIKFFKSLGVDPKKLSLIFDTETTGLFKTDVVVEIGWVLIDECDRVICKSSDLLYTTSIGISSSAQKTHGITSQMIKQRGKSPEFVLGEFLDLCRCVGTIVAHNASFDVRLVNQTIQYEGLRLKSLSLGNVFCTMKALRKRSTSERGNTVRNEDVYKFLYSDDDDVFNVHRALDDCRMTAKIYTHGRKLHWWS